MRESQGLRLRPMWVALAFFLALLSWANYYQLEQAVSAQGSIIPVTRTQVIQVADGGVLEKLLVQEGQSVKAGQLLAVLEKERASAGVQENHSRLAYLRASLTRAQAQAQLATPDFSTLSPKYADVAKEQMRLFEAKQQAYATEVNSIEQSLELAREELQVNEKLAESGDVSRLELLRSKRQVAELDGKLQTIRSKYIADAQDEAAKILGDIDSQRFRLQEKQSVLEHTDLVAPVDGIVKSLRVTTVGGVLRGGDELMQISPSDVELIVEAKVAPADIGLLREGLSVSIRLDAFDYSIYGKLNGVLSYISSDTLSEQGPNGQNMSLYRVQVKLDREQENVKIALSGLRPGMTGGIDIRTGSRSVLQYIAKPIVRAFQGAATQR